MASARNHEGLDARAVGELERAADVHGRALEWYVAAGIPSGVAFTESCLGFLATERGDPAGATRHHGAALAAATAADDPAVLTLALEGCASLHADPIASATLLGAASSLWAAAAPSTVPTHRIDVDATADAARHAIGADAVAVAMANGATLDRREALAVVRRAATS